MPQKNASISTYIAFLLHTAPRVYYNFFLPRPVHSCIGLGRKMGGMLTHLGCRQFMYGMEMGYSCRGNQKNGGGGGLELVWHIWSKGPVLLLSALLFMLKCTREIEEMTSLNVMH